MRRNSLATFLATALLAAAGAQDLDAFLTKSETMPRPPASESEMRMVITNKAGQSRVREIKSYSSTDAAGNDRQVLIFLAPADVRDTRFLTIDWESPSKPDEQYIYIPALRKVRSIGTAGGDSKTGAFLGSDFTFADIGSLDRADFTIRIAGEESLEGKRYLKIEYLSKGPATLKKYGYGKILRWMGAEDATMRQADYFDGSGKQVKHLNVKGMHLVDGKYWQFEAFEMSNLETGGRTDWIFDKVTILPKIDENYFSLRYLEKGR
ncbi:MAG: outer membrane lipoprotein-sorting protein [Spirochaetota bacterium]